VKLLFDQNISFRIIKIISIHFPESAQVRGLNLEGSTDRQIWEYAKLNNYVIVSFDADFYDYSNLYGHPPKTIWLRTGNTKTLYIANLLIQKENLIKSFLDDGEISCLEIY
jgi:predicted nuclease of predicted toxin-antitoxin system